MSTPVLSARGRKAHAVKIGDASAIERASRDLAAEKIAAYVERVVAEAPPLTAIQRDRITMLLSGGDAS
ncbi:hypothetical protein [Microbacterium laevaniformans]|uniref:hypothetical protein n=1 Tax=Microbacterium laevaniformans TaxID=36807 RepID=UPI00362E18D8